LPRVVSLVSVGGTRPHPSQHYSESPSHAPGTGSPPSLCRRRRGRSRRSPAGRCVRRPPPPYAVESQAAPPLQVGALTPEQAVPGLLHQPAVRLPSPATRAGNSSHRAGAHCHWTSRAPKGRGCLPKGRSLSECQPLRMQQRAFQVQRSPCHDAMCLAPPGSFQPLNNSSKLALCSPTRCYLSPALARNTPYRQRPSVVPGRHPAGRGVGRRGVGRPRAAPRRSGGPAHSAPFFTVTAQATRGASFHTV
jgi:hypothetical protein